MSSTAESPDGGMALQSHYSLRWNNHQAHILQSFEALLHAEIFVDVTLVCSDNSLRAHKVVLSACSPFFERIFAEHPCKHPVIVLKDYNSREVAALIDFMYRGEVRVGHEDLANLMRAAETLHVRGLASSEPRPVSPPATPTAAETSDELLGSDRLTPEPLRQSTPHDEESSSPRLASRGFRERERERERERLPHMTHLNFSLRDCTSPLPRRKQARPRRRSGELIPQDLSKPHPPPSPSPPLNFTSRHSPQNFQPLHQPSVAPNEDIAENLSMKRSESSPAEQIKTESEPASSPRCSPLTGTGLQPDSSIHDLTQSGMPALSALSLTPPHHQSEYLANLSHLAAHWGPGPQQAQLPHHREDSPHANRLHPFQDSALTPRRSVFPMDGTSLFPPGGLERGLLLADLHDSFKPEALHGLFGGANLIHHPTKKSKKHRGEDGPRRWSDHTRMPLGRPKGQHSAPRGGPPRSWTNAELTEALQHVWNKKMTTSQASRIFGIPYNSLLMYVRGKYGKSLKLEQLRKDCTGGEVMNSLNNNVKAVPPPQMSHPLGLPHPDDQFPTHSLLHQGFYPDFGAAFPVPVNMVHLLPPSEQKAFEAAGNPGAGPCELTPPSRSPSPGAALIHEIPQTPQSAPALLQQNGE
ncbi:protein jim lovell [Cotesia glomerata]|uniref:Protein jim lovell n=1 Tax=Cotesia glomerata TaxID=32391 RepID=A0AAV7IXN4_COTGL|nr:protein jim lovell [Cotesia glomerata]XP_044585374.1 protein jim lovell [Cotesia glomerata]XP_044585375.1 protein jim lovell [Cotesia glomerata]XP_044585376.1 protein jim lovell [Cotesia glomerata]XP_044585377.1 protein jim lovell [Cotesia glomerata]KAH0561582.1 hypothetical protein KQX54_017864 [Cotesia glomerata]